jgi:hypothetical protein
MNFIFVQPLKGKSNPRRGHEVLEGGRGIALLGARWGVGGQHYTPTTLPLGKRSITPGKGSWVGPRASLDGCRKISAPLAFNPQAVQPKANQ